MKILATILLTALLMLTSCSDDGPGGPTQSVDTTLPATITDLVSSNPTASTVTLNLTAPGDDGMLGRSRQYDVRYSTNSIDEASFESASEFVNSILPNVGSVYDTIIVNGLMPATKYYFAVKAIDEAGNSSDISNIDSATTLLSGNWNTFTQANSDLPSDSVNDIAVMGGFSYFATDYGLAKYTTTTWTIYDTMFNFTPGNTDYVIPTSKHSCVDVADNGLIWLGTYDIGIIRIDTNEDVTVFDATNSPINNYSIRDILVIAPDEFYAATTSAGIFHYQNDSWTHYTTENGLKFNVINMLNVDSNNNIWIAYNFGGVSMFDGVNFTHYNSSNGLNTSGVWDIEPLSNDSILFATEDGLYIFDGSVFSNINQSNSYLNDNVLTSVAAGTDGIWWIGTRYGLNRFDGTTWTLFTNDNSNIADDYIDQVDVDILNRVFVSYYYHHGVSIYSE